MGFYACNFIYDSICSSEFGLKISSSGDTETNDGASVSLLTQEIYRRPKTYLLGVQQTPTLSFTVQLNVANELSADEDSVVSKWLFGNMNYAKLQIIQPDMLYVYYNCIFTEKKTIRVGNIIRGYVATVVCDSPFAWEYPKSETHDYGVNGYLAYDGILINNTSDNADYTYPKVTFKMNVFGGYISIVNRSDNNREFKFTGLNPEEQITVDNDLQTITTSVSGVNRLADFVDFNWLRFVRNQNDLYVTGNIRSLSFEYQFARKIS